jgi:hypothetical protein
MAYDVARQRTVLFGGIAGAPLGDTWEWDGTTWTQRATTGPSPRSGAQLAWHPGIGRVVLFGGRSTSMLSDSWAWDGTVWTPLPAAGGPAPRASHALAFDALRGRLVLFGGELESLPRAGDTWEWDGTSWAPRARAVAPPARTEPAMAFDLIRQRMVLFGGESPSSGPFGDTWEYLASRSIVGPGHAEGGLALVCEPQPQAGVTCCLRFPSTQSSAVLLFWNAPPLSAPLPLAPPGMCRAGLLYPVPALPIPAPGNPATVCFPIPAVPQAVGLSFCVQGLVLQPGNCGLVTDAMVMTIQP